MRKERLELSRVAPLAPKASASTIPPLSRARRDQQLYRRSASPEGNRANLALVPAGSGLTTLRARAIAAAHVGAPYWHPCTNAIPILVCAVQRAAPHVMQRGAAARYC